MSENITFADLLKFMEMSVGRAGMPSKISTENAVSALRGFMSALDLSGERKVSTTLRGDFEKSLAAYHTKLREQGLKASSINNKTPLLNHWRRLVATLDLRGTDAATTKTPFQHKMDELYAARNDMPLMVKRAGISPGQIFSWRKYNQAPAPKSVPRLIRLATVLGEDPKSFVDLLGADIRFAPTVRPPTRRIVWRERMKELVKDTFYLKPKNWLPTMREEFRGLVIHKVPLARELIKRGLLDEIGFNMTPATSGLSLEEQVRRQVRVAMETQQEKNGESWRLRPLGDFCSRFPDWVNVIGDQVCPSAGATFYAFQCFLGWANRSTAKDGAGFHFEHLSLGLLADTELLDKFVMWRTARSLGVNGGVMSFLAIAGMMNRPETGYLWRSPHIGRRVGVIDAGAWRARCEQANIWCKGTRSRLQSIRKKTRNPAEPLQPLLDLPRPLAGFREGILLYAGVQRRPYWRVTQARDLALLAVSISNPLRLTNLRLLTFRPDGTGHFRLHPNDGKWYLHVPGIEFKNIAGAAKENYEQPLSPLATHYFEAYLKTYWPNRLNPNGGLVFVSQFSPNKPWDGLDEQYAQVTRRYMPGNVGLRTHAVRYLVGTAILMATQGNVQLAAKALHDMPCTVTQSYSQLLNSYTARGVCAAIGADMSVDDELVELVSTDSLWMIRRP